MPPPNPTTGPPRSAPAEQDPATWVRGAQVAFVTLCAAALRFHNLGGLPLWYDEAATDEFARLSWRELWSNFHETNPPLYFALIKAWTGWFGDSPAALRAVSAIAGTVAVPLVYVIGHSLRGHWAGLLAAAFLALSSIHIFYSQEARAFALLLLAAALALWGAMGVLARQGAPLRRAAAYVAGAATALYVHNTAVVFVALLNLGALIWWLREGHLDRAVARRWIAANFVVLALWAWWMPFVARQFVVDFARFSWIEQPAPADALATAVGVLGMDFTTTPTWSAAAFVVLALAGLAAWHDGGSRRTLLALLFVGTPLVTYAIGIYRPIFIARAIFWPVFVGCLLAGIAIASLRPRWFAGAAAALALLAQLPATWAYFNLEARDDEPWDRVVSFVLARPPADMAVVLCPNWFRGPLVYALRRTGSTVHVFGIETGLPTDALPADSTTPIWPEHLAALPDR